MRGTILTLVTVVSIALLALILFPPTTWATNITTDETVLVKEGEIVPDDLYAFGNTVRIDGTIDGDLYAFAREIIIGPNGRVRGDLVGAGQIIDIQGQVDDDVRAAGQIIRVAGPNVGDDLIAAGFSIEQTAENHIHGTVLAGAYQVLLAGRVGEDVMVGANGLEIRGHIMGDVRANVGERSSASSPPFTAFFGTPEIKPPQVPLGLTVTDGAIIEGDLTYQALEEAQIAPNATVHGQITHKLPAPRESERQERSALGSVQWTLSQAKRFISYFIIGLILFFIFPAVPRRIGRTLLQKPLPAFGWGIVGVLVTLAAIFIIFIGTIVITVILGLVSLGFLAKWTFILGLMLNVFIIVGYLVYTNLIVPVLVPYGVLSKLDRGGYWWVLPVLIGLILYVLLTALPYVGWLFALLAVLAGVGAVIVVWRERRLV